MKQNKGTFLKGDTNNSVIYIYEYNKFRVVEKGVLLAKSLPKT
jgi:hypothetical protein